MPPCCKQLRVGRLILRVSRDAQRRFAGLLIPVLASFAFVGKLVNKVAFSWWLDPALQRKKNVALWNDIQTNFCFLTSQSQMDSTFAKGLPFDYASVTIPSGNILVTITKGRGDVSVSVAPRHDPASNYALGPLIAALEGRHFGEKDAIHALAGAARLLRPRLEQMNAAFAVDEFSNTQRLLS